MTDKQWWLECWGLTNSPDAEEQWKRKVELDNKVSRSEGEIKPNMGIITDIQPYKSMIDGSIINSRSRHKTHLKDHGCIEVGNEVKAATTMPERKQIDFKNEIIKQVYLEKEKQHRK